MRHNATPQLKIGEDPSELKALLSLLDMGIIFYLAIVASGLAAAFAISKALKAIKLI